MNDLTERQTTWLSDLRHMLEWMEDHPQFIAEHIGFQVDLFVYGDDQLGQMREMIRGHGKWNKEDMGSWFTLRKSFGEHKVQINAVREEVCERVEVGTETVTIPDPDAPKVTVERPVYEWKCPESVLASAS